LKSVDLPTFGNPTMPHLKPNFVSRASATDSGSGWFML
jgi:hypothetical protein